MSNHPSQGGEDSARNDPSLSGLGELTRVNGETLREAQRKLPGAKGFEGCSALYGRAAAPPWLFPNGSFFS